MEIIIAILWYFQILVTGTSYSQADIDAMVTSNHQLIEATQQDAQQMNTVMGSFQSNAIWDPSTNVVEEWDPTEEEMNEGPIIE